VAGEALHYEVAPGRGPYLLLVHGLLSSRSQWLPNLDALSAVCRPVVSELFGHGRSPAPTSPDAYHPVHYVECFEEIRRELGAERWLVLGQSLGAALTARYALDCPDRVVAQVLTNSNSTFAADWDTQLRPRMELFARSVEEGGAAVLERMPVHPKNSRSLPAEVKRALVADAEQHDPRGIGLTALHTVVNSPVLDRVGENRVPALLVCGSRERRFAPQRELARAKMPALEIVDLDGGHAVNVDAADEFNRVVAAFIARHAPAALT
jgi:pimeloyl-ACP methyl ester carboxylesterase